MALNKRRATNQVSPTLKRKKKNKKNKKEKEWTREKGEEMKEESSIGRLRPLSIGPQGTAAAGGSRDCHRLRPFSYHFYIPFSFEKIRNQSRNE